MTDKDILFKDLSKEELAVKPQNEIAHFGWEGDGAAVFHDVPDYAVVVGVPAKIIRYQPQ